MTSTRCGDRCVDRSIAGAIDRLAMIARWLSLACMAVAAMSTPVAAQSPPYVAHGIRWIGAATECVAPAGWRAERVFSSAPPGVASLCLYLWLTPDQPPAPAQVAGLFSVSGATDLTEDVAVVFPSASFSPEEQALIDGLRSSLRAQVGTAALVPNLPAAPAARIVVIDSAPDAAAGQIVPGASRHGDTLAHLIEDLACAQTGDGQRCAAEVTTALALPQIAPGVSGPDGGHVGTLSDLARAIERALLTWQADRGSKSGAPPRLVLNLSLGWEDTPGIADCTDGALATLKPPARAVRGILQQAAAQGALIIAAAGNNSGGPSPRTGLVCPGRYQSVPKDSDASQSLVIAVSGVDYQDRPLAQTRPGGIAGIAALGLGGVAWDPSDPTPPPLTGTSVSTAVVSAIAAVVWAFRPSFTVPGVVSAIYRGGVDLGNGDRCPRGSSLCRSRRASACGALRAAGATLACAPPAARSWSCPSLPGQVNALIAAHNGVVRSIGTLIPASDLPNDLAPSVQVAPEVFPAPISATCPTCLGADASATSNPVLVIPRLGQDLDDAVLVVHLTSGNVQALQLGALAAAGAPYVYPLPRSWVLQSAYLTGFDANSFSVTAQICVQQ
jgi:Subtilase family